MTAPPPSYPRSSSPRSSWRSPSSQPPSSQRHFRAADFFAAAVAAGGLLPEQRRSRPSSVTGLRRGTLPQLAVRDGRLRRRGLRRPPVDRAHLLRTAGIVVPLDHARQRLRVHVIRVEPPQLLAQQLRRRTALQRDRPIWLTRNAERRDRTVRPRQRDRPGRREHPDSRDTWATRVLLLDATPSRAATTPPSGRRSGCPSPTRPRRH